MTSRSRAILLIVALLALRVASVLVLGKPENSTRWVDRVTFIDFWQYEDMADDFADGSWDSPSFRTPGYPLLMLLTRSLLPVEWLATVCIQQLVDATVALMCFFIARRVTGGNYAAVAAGLYMLLPSQLIWSTQVAPDVWVGLFACLSGVVWLSALGAQSVRTQAALAIVCGLCLSMGTWFKPIFVYTAFVYIVALVLLKRTALRTRIIMACCIAVSAYAGPAVLRHINSARFGLNALSTQEHFEPMARAVVRSEYHGIENDGTIWAFRDSIEAEYTHNGAIDYASRDSVFSSIMIDAIRSDPLRLICIEFTRWPKFFMNFDANSSYLGLTAEDRKPLPWAIVTSFVQTGLLLAFAYVLFVRRIWRRSDPTLLMTALWFFYSVPVCGPLAGFRYGIIFYWAMIPSVAIGLETVHARLRSRRLN